MAAMKVNCPLCEAENEMVGTNDYDMPNENYRFMVDSRVCDGCFSPFMVEWYFSNGQIKTYFYTKRDTND